MYCMDVRRGKDNKSRGDLCLELNVKNIMSSEKGKHRIGGRSGITQVVGQ